MFEAAKARAVEAAERAKVEAKAAAERAKANAVAAASTASARMSDSNLRESIERQRWLALDTAPHVAQ